MSKRRVKQRGAVVLRVERLRLWLLRADPTSAPHGIDRQPIHYECRDRACDVFGGFDRQKMAGRLQLMHAKPAVLFREVLLRL